MNDLINKIGIDKVLHFSFGGLISSLLTFVVILQEGNTLSYSQTLFMPIIGAIAVFIISIIKEASLDEEFNWKDIIASILGTLTVFIAVSIGVLFNIWSN